MTAAEKTGDRRRQMVKLLLQLTTGEGMQPSILEGVKLLRANRSYRRTPALYEPSIVIIANGRKRAFVGDKCVVYDANNYLVLAVPLPFECETEASGTEPLLGLSIRIEINTLSELVMKMDLTGQPPAPGDHSSISAMPVDLTLIDAAIRLLECLRLPADAAILGPAVVREIIYRVLCGSGGGTLLGLLSRNSQLAQICRTHFSKSTPTMLSRWR